MGLSRKSIINYQLVIAGTFRSRLANLRDTAMIKSCMSFVLRMNCTSCGVSRKTIAAADFGWPRSQMSWIKEWRDVRPGSEVLDCLRYLESEALREVNVFRAWRRKGDDTEPFDLMLISLHKGETFFRAKTECLG